jgi:hypothetical protein
VGVTLPGERVPRAVEIGASAKKVEVTIPKERRVWVRGVDSETGTTVGPMAVWVKAVGPVDPGNRRRMPKTWESSAGGHDGQATVTFWGETRSGESLDEYVRATVRVEAEGFLPAEVSGPKVLDMEGGELVVPLRKADGVGVRVVDAAGRPVKGVRVGRYVGERDDPTARIVHRNKEVGQAITGEDGSAQVWPADGAYVVWAMGPDGWAMGKRAADEAGGELRLREFATVEGQVVGRIEPGRKLEAGLPAYPGATGGIKVPVPVGEDGRFRVGGAADGTCWFGLVDAKGFAIVLPVDLPVGEGMSEVALVPARPEVAIARRENGAPLRAGDRVRLELLARGAPPTEAKAQEFEVIEGGGFVPEMPEGGRWARCWLLDANGEKAEELWLEARHLKGPGFLFADFGGRMALLMRAPATRETEQGGR